VPGPQPDPAVPRATIDVHLAEEITAIVRAEHGRVVASLIRRLKDIDLA